MQTEAPLLIRPYLADMTYSEIHAVMTGGFSTIAGSVMGAYMSFGVSAEGPTMWPPLGGGSLLRVLMSPSTRALAYWAQVWQLSL